MNKGGFSRKRFLGISQAKARISRQIGIPLTRSGRQRKIGAALGCLIPVLAQIEIFFRFIKQNLKIKAFIGNSENAVLTQIYAALIVYLLLCYLKFLCNLSITLQNCIRILQLNLFRTCTVQELFEPPEMIADNICHPKQLTLALA